jgi:hypothetical protein
MFGNAIIIAGDRTCANVCFPTDPGIAHIGKVVNFGAAFDGGVFDFDKIADMRMLSYAGSRSQSGKGSNDRAAGKLPENARGGLGKSPFLFATCGGSVRTR